MTWYERLWARVPGWLQYPLCIVGFVLFMGTFGVIAQLLTGAGPGFGK